MTNRVELIGSRPMNTACVEFELRRRDPAPDALCLKLLEAARAGGLELRGIRQAQVYELYPLNPKEAELLAERLLLDPALDLLRAGPAEPADDELVISLMRREGVMDPVALSIKLSNQKRCPGKILPTEK